MGAHAILKTQKEVLALLQDIFDEKKIVDPKIEICSGANKGDGYLSSMNKVTVTGDDGKVLNLILKCAPQSKEFRKFAPIEVVFGREIYFYEKLYPEIVKFQAERKIENPFNNVPFMYKTQNVDLMEIIVLDNIRLRGFDLFDRREHMNDEHAKYVLENYGKFHAISFAMQDQNKKLYDTLTEDLTDVLHRFPKDFFDSLALMMSNTANMFTEDEDRDVKEALLKFKDVESDFIYKMAEKPNYNVINHGDCWCTNMMFKYDESNKISDMMLLDFQLCRASSPVFDLAYFLYVSCGKDIHDNLDHYLLWYYESLKNRTKALGSDIKKLYPFSQIKEDWKKYSRFGMIMGLSLIKAVLMEADEMFDIMDIAEMKDDYNSIINKKFKNDDLANERIRNLCKHIVRSGFLEC